MKIRPITYISFSLIAIIVIASIQILKNAKQDLPNAHQSPLDSYVNAATAMDYDETGKLKYKLTAQRINHYKSTQQEKTVFIKPIIAAYPKSKTSWHIQSDQAESDNKGTKITFSGHVILNEVAKTPMQLTTTYLIYYPKASIATTNAAVTIHRPGLDLTGVGLVANFKTNQYQLKSKSHAIYTPSNP